MSIRKHLDLEDDSNFMAKQVFVMIIVNINGTWKLPVGYFLVVVSQCIQLVSATGARVVSLTFDGAPSNIAVANTLGTNNSYDSLKHIFL
ncbi:unnamed protein product [Acanthoscelides obtectus]|uniref:Transposable element P transposase-like RNase H domain-containing protein n=1 Tax=Acanthoscelides obtectus TaxID=200917 RepID=A0A9P0KHP0_ACAOB|nr:unnamed protein product [Acanthoscelides obtectus]CAK1664972.1 hypothetical protein AOBTE_LOCUS24589 [Acanthoscelides obtectus]